LTLFLFQVISLEANEIEWVCNHLGHNVQIDKDFYRQHYGAVEIAKVGKLLLAAENGNVSKYSGKKLSDIECELSNEGK